MSFPLFSTAAWPPETAFGLEQSARVGAKRHGRGPLLWVLRSPSMPAEAEVPGVGGSSAIGVGDLSLPFDKNWERDK